MRISFFIKNILLAFCLCLTSSWTTIDEAHDIHISKALIDYNESEKALQISLHIFLDDLEEILMNRGADKLFICTEKESKKAEKHIYQYLQDRFKLTVNQEAVQFDFIGKEPSEDLLATWCYIEVTGVDQLDVLEVQSQILMDLYDDQVNIVNVNYPGKKQGYFLFNHDENKQSVSFLE